MSVAVTVQNRSRSSAVTSLRRPLVVVARTLAADMLPPLFLPTKSPVFPPALGKYVVKKHVNLVLDAIRIPNVRSHYDGKSAARTQNTDVAASFEIMEHGGRCLGFSVSRTSSKQHSSRVYIFYADERLHFAETKRVIGCGCGLCLHTLCPTSRGSSLSSTTLSTRMDHKSKETGSTKSVEQGAQSRT